MILISLAACGDDGNQLDATCGDGLREGAEQCDDGNTASGDGCSASCTSELTMSCGNGATEGTEQCDDGNANDGDGCSATCQTETATCGDGNITGTETCDDSNTTSGDGCSATCQTETPAGCGDGAIVAPEICDDGNMASGDGCSATCTEEVGYTCTGMPSVCTMPTPAGTCAAPFVVNLTATAGVLSGTGAGDTTASTNQVPMLTCSGGAATAGAGKDHVYRFTTTDVRDIAIEIDDTITTFDTVLRVLSVPCDPTMDVEEVTNGGADGCADYTLSGEIIQYTALPAGTYYVVIDGYSAAATDAGAYSFTITARPTLCGNGVIDPISAIPNTDAEFCDDMDLMSGDGCNARCEVEPGFTCSAAEPSVCTQTCGNGVLDSGETCDDGGTVAGNGCSAVCQVEPGYLCTGTPSVCALACGNGVIDAGETCDDGGTVAGNGCSATCQTEAGYVCSGTPSTCVMSCGNGTLNTGEECEDGNTANGDRCSASCILEFDTAEVEPNNTTAQVLGAGSHIIKGTLIAGDVDLYSFTLTGPATVDLEVYDRMDNVANYTGVGTLTNVDCFVNDTELRLFNSTGNPATNSTALYFDDNDGDETCSYLGPNDSADGAGADPTEGVLAAGTYTIKINDLDPAFAAGRYLIDLKITSATIAPVAGSLVINEIMAADNLSDTNCDSSTTDTFDEFVELVNVTTDTLDLSGVTIAETGAPTVPRHVFAAGTTLAPGKAFVVWGGGAPACPGVTQFAVASVGLLSLNDSGDTVTVATGGATPVTIASKMFSDAEAEINVSLNRSPDVTGTAYALHTAVAGAVGAFSPGKRSDGTAF